MKLLVCLLVALVVAQATSTPKPTGTPTKSTPSPVTAAPTKPAATKPAVTTKPTTAPTDAPVATDAPANHAFHGPRMLAAFFCMDDIDRLCPASRAQMHTAGLIPLLACLNKHQTDISTTCLNALRNTPPFACAPDAARFCPGMTCPRKIARCLMGHKDSVSTQCRASVHRMHHHRHRHHRPGDDDEMEGHEGGPHLGGLIFILLIVFATCGVIRCVRKRRRCRLARLQAMAAANGAEVQMAPTGLSQPPATTSPAPRATYAAGVPSSSAPTSFGGYTRVNLQEV